MSQIARLIQRAQYQQPEHASSCCLSLPFRPHPTRQSICFQYSPFECSPHTVPTCAFSARVLVLFLFCIHFVPCTAALYSAEPLLTLPTLLTCICSSGTYLTRPDTIVRGSASPTSIFSTYRLRMWKQCGLLVQVIFKWSLYNYCSQSLPQSCHAPVTLLKN